MGFFRNLTHGEIVDQVQIINDIAEETYGKKITNIVYMGMGEPMHNFKSVVESARIISNPLGWICRPGELRYPQLALRNRSNSWLTWI